MNPQAQAPTPPKKGHGCFFYGCIISLVLVLVLCLGAFVAFRMVIAKMNRMVTEYTDTTPMALPKVEMSTDDIQKLKARVETFSKAVNAHSNTPPLILTGPELNALIASDKDTKDAANHFFITLEGSSIKGQVSLPLDPVADKPFLRQFHLQGRYLNGSATFSAGVTNGMLGVYIQSIEAKGKPLPPQFTGAFSQQNLADSYNKNPQNGPAFEEYESITVKDGTMMVTPKKE